MAFQLKIVCRDGETRIVPLSEGDWLIGRSRNAQIQVEPPDVSGKHLVLHVAGGSVIAENLSSHGSRTSKMPIELPTPIHAGETVFLGKSLSITLEQTGAPPDAAPAGAPDETDPGNAPCPVPQNPDIDRTILEEPSPVNAANPNTSDTILDDAPGAGFPDSFRTLPGEPFETVSDKEPGAAENDVFKTNVMQTRIASVEELDFLRRQDRKHVQGKKLKYFAGIAVLAFAVAAVYLFHGNPPEEKLSWPCLADGSFSEKPFDAGDGGFAGGRFSVIAPLVPSTEHKRTEQGGLLITTRIGRDRDVPMRILLMTKKSPDFLREDRLASLNRWMKEISNSGGHWNFGQVSDLFFIGGDNGLPCHSVSYSREYENQSWYGEVLFFRNADERVVRLVEIPASERVRGAEFLGSYPFLFFAGEFIENHWEGGGQVYGGPPEELLNEAKSLLMKMSPATWDKVMSLLRNVLTASMTSGNNELREHALEQLRKLRNNQRVWYNAQRIAYLKEKSTGNERGANIIRDSCLSVFSSEDDLRNLNIRRNRWE